MSHRDLLKGIWDGVVPGSEPERFAVRRDWLLARVTPGTRVVDLGCGEGAFAAALHAHGAHPLGIDVVAEPLRRARVAHPQLPWRLAALDGPLPLEDGAAEVVWTGEVIEHVVDPVGWLSEIRRVLPSGGRLLLTTPDHPPALLHSLADDPAAFDAHFDPRADHLRFFGARTLRALVEDLRFDVAALDSDGETLFLEAVRARF